ncbi:MAG: aspartate aminotransferase family protein [Actinobacteria bacterium]|nr:aspartate aminotransferase family protein [Actinomycetota bacterium]
MSSTITEKEYVEKHKKYMIEVPGFAPLIITEAKGSVFKDINGREYIDFASMVAGPTSIGSSHPKVIEALKKQLDKVMCASPWFMNIPKIELAEKLSKITPPRLNKFHFLCGGGEANEYALHIAMKATKKSEVISLYYGYHGSSFGTLALGQPWHRRNITMMPGFRQIPPAYCYRCFYGGKYPDCTLECATALEHMIKLGSYDSVVVFLAEPIQGNGGHVMPPKEYFKIIRDICTRNGVLLMFDEIQTGFGRTGKMWGADYYDVEPDIMVMGKAMGGGFPISCAAFSDDIPIPLEEDQEIVSTFADSPLGCTAASAAIDVVLGEKLPEKAAKLGEYVLDRLNEMQERHRLIGDVRSVGLFCAIELVKDRKTKERALEEAMQVVTKCREKGAIFLLANKSHIGTVVKFNPPMSISKELLSKGLDILDESLTEVEKK